MCPKKGHITCGKINAELNFALNLRLEFSKNLRPNSVIPQDDGVPGWGCWAKDDVTFLYDFGEKFQTI